ncbi:MAG: hypothetical protein M0D57_14860 [Sphingobacteriales bacterium JAD_PAG50586_3]|nr:MAG: hypothetical protein M0D57_14860 [Sphingobacteriales bacterium JAD_PAG50586_3]
MVDVLFTQFSYAAWVGNVGDFDAQKRQAVRKVNEIKRQAEVLQPKYIIPFASFVWFCNVDNFYLNEGVNRIPEIYKYIKDNTNAKPIILFVEDKWNVGTEYDSTQAIDSWEKAYTNALSGNTVANKQVSADEIMAAGNNYAKQLVQNNSLFVRMLKPAKIYVTDLNQAYKFSLNGLETANYDYDSCDIALSADALNYCFKFKWGGSTIRVNGRYQVPKNGKFYNMKMYFQVAQLNNFNQSFNLWYIAGVILQKLRNKILGNN